MDGPSAILESNETRDRVAALDDWANVTSELNSYGCAVIGPLVTPEECDALTASYETDSLFRSRVVMARHGYGRGEYRYFSYPLPLMISKLRTALYPPLAEIANPCNETMRIETRYPGEHQAFVD